MNLKVFLSSIIVFTATAAYGRTVEISSSEMVEDCSLKKSLLTYEDDLYWTEWNFGASQVLDAGRAIAMWNMWDANSLVRFDLGGVSVSRLHKATFRIYAPANVTQKDSVIRLGVYRVDKGNALWREGDKESLASEDGASWLYATENTAWKGGQGGCDVRGADYDAAPIGIAECSKYIGQWLEFDLPVEMVCDWISNPETNAGLLLKVEDECDGLGNHVLVYSSEHSSGKGPRLILEADGYRCKDNASRAYNRRAVMPKPGRNFNRYLKECRSRYPKWTTDTVVNLTGDQKIYPYYWDIVTDGNYVLPYSYYPLSQSILGLDDMIAARDTAGLKKFQKDRLRYLHKWEYIREQRWYDCGDIIEWLEPFQAACIWMGSSELTGQSFKGILQNSAVRNGLEQLTDREIQERRLAEVKECVENLNLTQEQYEAVEKFISRAEYERCLWFNRYLVSVSELYKLLRARDNGPMMIDALSEFMNCHDMFLFYDSYWQMYRWTFLMDNVDMVDLNIFWKKQKFGEYSPQRIRKRFEESLEYWPANIEKPELKSLNTY